MGPESAKTPDWKIKQFGDFFFNGREGKSSFITLPNKGGNTVG